MSRGSVLTRGRAAAERGMTDACTIRRRTGTSTDPATGVTVPTYLSPDPYAGKCRVQAALAQAGRAEPGEDFLLLLRLEVQLPVSVTGLAVGDQVTITAAAHDADLIGRVFTIRDLAHKSEATSRRVGVIEKTGS